jgi:transcriptional regulator with XRE-family HTH domain
MENKFSANLRALRKKNRFTLETLGKALSISKSTLSDYETGKTAPSFEVCVRMADFFGINIDELRVADSSENKSIHPNLFPARSSANGREDAEKTALLIQKNQLEFQNKILNQQVEGLQVQLTLVNQIIESKTNEIRSLRMQIKLLEEYVIDAKK